jgi:hypothetical protein
MSQGQAPLSTRICIRWGQHKAILEEWNRKPPLHPENPRYQGFEFEVQGRYSWFESVVNVFRRKQWLDAPPADYKWAVLTVRYRAPMDPMDQFAALSHSAQES